MAVASTRRPSGHVEGRTRSVVTEDEGPSHAASDAEVAGERSEGASRFEGKEVQLSMQFAAAPDAEEVTVETISAEEAGIGAGQRDEPELDVPELFTIPQSVT